MKKTLFLFIFTISAFALTAQYCNDRFLCQCSSIETYKDVLYKTATDYAGISKSLKLDIYKPKDNFLATKRPTILFIHGGAFISGDKTDFAIACETFAKMGFTTATVQYRLGFTGSNTICNPANWEEMKPAVYRALQDAGDAINFLVDKKDTYSVDPDNIFLVGYSAGAVTALHLAYASQDEMDAFDSTLVKKLGPLTRNKGTLKGVVSLAGFLMNEDVVDANEQIPMLLFHGTCDLVVGYPKANILPFCGSVFPVVSGSEVIAERAKSIGIPNSFITYCGHGHDLLPALSIPITCSTANFIHDNLLCGQSVSSSITYIAPGDENGCNICIKPKMTGVALPTVACGAACSSNSGYCSPVSTDELSEVTTINIYPNPAFDRLTIESSAQTEIKAIRLTNHIGQVIPCSLRTNVLDIQHLPQGVYYLSIETSDALVTKSFVKM